MWTFEPILKSTLWGGNKLISYKGLNAEHSDIGESWEISGVSGDESIVSSGPDKGLMVHQLIDKYGASLLGKRNYQKFGNKFPLLVKFIDSNSDLSVQVHPDDKLAQELGLDNGKTEMWYIIRAEENARIANGFSLQVDSNEYDELVESGKIEDVLRFMNVKQGDVYFIPAGRIHSIGAGCTILEIQQTSDTTYRIYDYHRVDKSGKERELHTELAKRAINFNDTDGKAIEYTQHSNLPVNIIDSETFIANYLETDTKMVRDYSERDTFVILVSVGGNATIQCAEQTIELREGSSALIPASANGIVISPKNKVTIIETYIS